MTACARTFITLLVLAFFVSFATIPIVGLIAYVFGWLWLNHWVVVIVTTLSLTAYWWRGILKGEEPWLSL